MARRPFWLELFKALLVLAVIAYSWLFSDVTVPNERTRAYLTVAIVDDHTFQVDAPLKRFGRVYDLATFDGHYFTDKAPGSSFLAVPVYAAARVVRPDHSFTIVEIVNLIRTWLMLPFAALGFLLLRAVLRRLGVSEPSVDLSSFGYALGSVALHYGGAFYGHVLVATCVLAVIYALARAGVLDAGESSLTTRSYAAWCALAGAAAGLAGLVEYQAIVVSALLAIPLLARTGRARILGVISYGVGAIPFAATLLVYNARAFGGAFELSYEHLVGQSLQDLHGFGLAGATRPTWAAIEGLLVSQHRGLVTTSPLMGIGLVGLALSFERLNRAFAITCVLAIGYFVLIVASSSVWYGGWSFGPRLLTPIAPLCALTAALWLDRLDRSSVFVAALRGAVVLGIAYQVLVQVTFAELPPTAQHPIADSVWPMLAAGQLSPNLACKVAPLGLANLAPLVVLLAVLFAWLVHVRELPRARRVLSALTSVGVAAVALLALWLTPPSGTPKQREKWVKLAATWTERETTCRD